MWTDVVDMRAFYESGTGQVARRMIRRQIRAIWPDVRGQAVLGLGYATPYLRPFRGEATRVVAAMPAGQGVLHWPPEGPSASVLADDGELPFPDLSMDRVLLVHAVEQTEQLRRMLREAWRVMSGGGRMLVVAPNRRGIWARFERTPFGHGRPYSEGQLSRLLRDNMFTPEQSASALFVPPSRLRMVLGSAPVWERIGVRWFQPVAGVVLIEASKQIYAATAVEVRREKQKSVIPAPKSPARSTTGNSAAREPVDPVR